MRLQLQGRGWYVHPPLTPSTLAGCLELRSMDDGIGPTNCRSLDPWNGLNFRKIVLVSVEEANLKSAMDPVSGCPGAPESLDLAESTLGVFFFSLRV